MVEFSVWYVHFLRIFHLTYFVLWKWSSMVEMKVNQCDFKSTWMKLKMEKIPMEEGSTKYWRQQTKCNSVPKIKEERMNFNLESLHVQRNKWKGNHRNSLCWGFIMSMIIKKIDGENLKIMICILCYNILVIVINPKTQTRRSKSYYKTNGITTLRKHVDAKHSIIAKSLKRRWTA